MEIIKKVEKQPRGVYCGAIGILVPQGPSIFNVAIRTLQMEETKAIYGVGGGLPGTVTGNPNTKKPSKSCCSIPSEPKI